MKDIVIIGSGGLAKEVVFLIEEINKIENKWKILGFIDDNIEVNHYEYSIIGEIVESKGSDEKVIINGINS